jgi:DHA3 family macrolide efflux protein-like MFS transporter
MSVEPPRVEGSPAPGAPDGESAAQAGVRATARVWRSRLAAVHSGDLRLVWLAQAISQLGDGMFTVGVVLLVVRLTGSGLALSGTLIAQLLPYAVLGPAAGALADRWNRRLTMVGSDVVRGVVVSLIPALELMGVLQVWMVPVVAFLLTSAGQFFDPARNALVPAITPHEDLVRVNALLSGTRQVLFIAGPALAGVVVAIAGTMGVFWLDGASFLLSAAILVRMRTSGHARRARSAAVQAADAQPEAGAPDGGARGALHAARGAGLWADIVAGLRYVWTVPVLRMVLIFGTAVNFLLSPLPVIIPLFFLQALGIDEAAFGPLLSVIFFGFLVGVAYVGILGHRLRIGLLTVGAIVVAGAAAFVFGLGPPLPVILGVGLVGGAAIGALEVAEATVLQRESSDELRGRVFALYESVSQGGRAIAVALAGGLSEIVGLRHMFAAVGVLTVLCALGLAASPAVRRVR